MSRIRFGALGALALTFVLAACSTENDLAATPNLEPQFGTANDDVGLGGATISTGRIYALWQESGEYYDDWGDGIFRNVYLRRYDNNGNVTFNKLVEDAMCSYEGLDYGDCDVPRTSSFTTNAQGKVYALYSYRYVGSDCPNIQFSSVEVYDGAGYELNRVYVGSTGKGFDSYYNAHVAMAVDGSGNIYVVAEQAEVDESDCVARNVVQTISKRSPTGSLLWQRASTVGFVYSITVTSTGNIYVIGSQEVWHATRAPATSSGPKRVRPML